MDNKLVETALDELLKQAFENESQRPIFLEKLLDSYVYILGTSSVEHDGDAAQRVVRYTLKVGIERMVRKFYHFLLH